MSHPAKSVEPHYTLKEAIERFFPGGQLTVRSLRTEIRKGHLRAAVVAGKFLVSETAIHEMLEACVCRVSVNILVSTSKDEIRRVATYGLSEMERLKSRL